MMRLRVPLVTRTVLSLAAVSAWGYMAALAIGPAAPLHLIWRHPVASYMALAEAPTGNGWELFAVVAFIFRMLPRRWLAARPPPGERN